RVLEAIFHRPIQLLTLIILLPLVGLAISYFYVPRTYSATASLWAIRRYQVIGATGPESNLLATPAQTQTTALTELLQSRSFALAVVHGIALAPTLHLASSLLADPQRLDDALVSEISHVQATAQGDNLYTITYTNRDPKVAEQI